MLGFDNMVAIGVEQRRKHWRAGQLLVYSLIGRVDLIQISHRQRRHVNMITLLLLLDIAELEANVNKRAVLNIIVLLCEKTLRHLQIDARRADKLLLCLFKRDQRRGMLLLFTKADQGISLH